MSEKRVLIVDDSKDIGRMIAAAVGTLDPGVQVKIEPSAEEAVLEITRQVFDLLVVDIRLPGVNGLDLTRRIRSRNPGLKIIQISGLDDPQVVSEALEAGANAFFHKPISMSEFLKTAAVFLGLRSAEPEVQISLDLQNEALAESMAEVLASARKALNGIAVVMTDSRGHIVLQAGKLPDPDLETSLVPEITDALLASARVGVRLGELHPEHILGFKGPAYHVVVAPVFAGYALMIFLRVEKSSLRLALAFEEAMQAQQDLYQLIQSSPGGLAESAPVSEPESNVPASPEVADHVPVPEHGASPAGNDQEPAASGRQPPASIPEEPAGTAHASTAEKVSLEDSLENLLRASADSKLEPGDVDAFWDDLSAQDEHANTDSPDTLSYDQAIRMGLAPKPDE